MHLLSYHDNKEYFKKEYAAVVNVKSKINLKIRLRNFP